MANAYSTSLSQNRSFPKVHKSGGRSTGLTPYAGPWTTKEVVHLLKRTMFGAGQADIAHFAAMSMAASVDELLTAGSAPVPPLNNYNDANYTDPNVPLGQPWVTAPYDSNVNGKRKLSFKSWWTGLMLNQGRSIDEKMTLFWSNHFSTEINTVGDPRFSYKTNALLRQYALGNFKDIVKQVTIDPGMLRYLNGYLNTKNAPDENYGRELQELFTVGKEPVQQFTEDDVKAAARVLTGYKIDATNVAYYFDSTKHDTTDKQFSAFYNNTVITGQSGANGEAELDDLLNMIFATNEVAEFICRKIYRFFIYYTIDSTVETNVIQPLATIFRNNNYEIKPVLDALFKSEHFFDELNRGCVIKSPADYYIGACREYNAQFPASPVDQQYYFWKILEYQLATTGMDIGDPPNVAGWPAYYQAPSYHEIWINSDTLPKRTQFTDLLVNQGYTHSGNTVLFDTLAFVAGLSVPNDPNVVINETLAIFYSIDTDTSLFTYLKSILLSGQVSDGYWTTAWDDYVNNPGNQTYLNIVKTRLNQMFQYLMDLAEYQLC